MAITCLFYMGCIYFYNHYSNFTPLPSDLVQVSYIAFSCASIILFYIAFWHWRNPAEYEAFITNEKFVVNYPESEQWSFEVKIKDIKRFEHRNSLSHAGKGISRSGVLLHDGTFHEISMNYGNRIKDMYLAVKKVNPKINFSSKVNLKVKGPLIDKEYDS